MRAEKATIMVTGTGGSGVGEGIVKALKLASPNYRILASDVVPLSAPLFRADKGFLVPFASEKNYTQHMIAICKTEGVKAIVPGSVPEIKRISEDRHMFQESGIVPVINPRAAIDVGLDKWKTYEFLRKNGFGCPITALPDAIDELVRETGFPLLVKPRSGYGSRGVFAAENKQELSFFIRYLQRLGLDPLIQQQLSAEGREYTVGVVVFRSGKLGGSISMQREMKSGFSYRMIVEDFAEVRKYAEAIALKLRAEGSINVQCIMTDDGPSPFEINPRFSGTTPVRAACGFNEVDAVVRNFLWGEEVGKLTYRKGLAVVRYLDEIYVERESLQSLETKKSVEGGGSRMDYM